MFFLISTLLHVLIFFYKHVLLSKIIAFFTTVKPSYLPPSAVWLQQIAYAVPSISLITPCCLSFLLGHSGTPCWATVRIRQCTYNLELNADLGKAWVNVCRLKVGKQLLGQAHPGCLPRPFAVFTPTPVCSAWFLGLQWG